MESNACLVYYRHIREHMKEHMPEADELKLDDAEAMEFHYFKLHDYDNNNKLDGLELAAAMTHYHEDGEGSEETLRVRVSVCVCVCVCDCVYIVCVCAQNIDISDDELSNLVDSILDDDDLNNDGYIDYYEFVQAQRRNRGDTA